MYNCHTFSVPYLQNEFQPRIYYPLLYKVYYINLYKLFRQTIYITRIRSTLMNIVLYFSSRVIKCNYYSLQLFNEV